MATNPNNDVFVLTHVISGNISVADGSFSYPVPRAAELVGFRATLGTAPATTTAIFNVAKNGTKVFAAVANANSVNNKALTSNVATLTTAAAHGLKAGAVVSVAGVGSPFDGTWVIASVPSTTTFTYAVVGADVTSGAVSPVGHVVPGYLPRPTILPSATSTAAEIGNPVAKSGQNSTYANWIWPAVPDQAPGAVFAKGDLLRVDVEAIGTGTVGANLVFEAVFVAK